MAAFAGFGRTAARRAGAHPRAAAALVALAAAALAVLPASAGAAVRLTTPYPAVAVEPGETVTLELQVGSTQVERVELEVTQVPPGWSAILRGGGFVVDGVTAGTREPPELELEVRVPAEAERGVHELVVAASGESGSDALPIELRVAEAARGEATLTGQYLQLRGPADSTFVFSLVLDNLTPREATFALEAAGPEGWQVTARPAGEQLAATVRVDAGGSATIEVEADPPDSAPAGRYPIAVRASAGAVQAEAALEVEITGDFAMTLTTPTQRLNADVGAGDTTSVPLLVVNEGTAPLVGIELEATPPSDWDVEFEPRTIELLEPGDARQVVARITPSGDAVAGDYVVTMRASVPETTAEVDIRTTVKTSRTWGAVGIGLIVAAVIGLGWVFRRFGRR